MIEEINRKLTLKGTIMDSSILTALLVLFLLMFLGYFLVKFGVVKEAALKHFSNFIFYVTMPALIINSMSNTESISKDQVITVVLMAFALYGFLIVMAYILPVVLKVNKSYTGLYRFMAIFGNVGFVGFPVLKAVLGSEALFYAAIFNIPFNILAFTLGVYFITLDTEHESKIELKNFINPGIVATIIGLFIFFTGIELPAVVSQTAENLGNITTPLSLIVVGGSLYGVNIKQLITKRIIFIYSIIKLFIIPTLFALVIRFLGIDSMIASVAIILASMPIGANSVIISQEYDAHVLEASEAVFISTLLTIISLPYIVYLIGIVL